MQLPSASRDCARFKLLEAEVGTCQWLSLAPVDVMRDVLRLVDVDPPEPRSLLQNCNGRSTIAQADDLLIEACRSTWCQWSKKLRSVGGEA
jgi:hypothetical protein